MAIQFQNIQIIRNPISIGELPIVTGSLLNIWVWGDSNINSVTASIKNGLAYEGYTASISTSLLTTAFTGDIITGSNQPDVLLYWTNGGGAIGASTLARNLRTYVNTGKGFVTSVFIPSIRPTNWDTKLTPLSGTGTQGYTNLGTGSLVSSSIILQGVDLALNQSNQRSYFYQSIASPVTHSGAVVSARWSSVNQPLLVEQISGSNNTRLAWINMFLPNAVNNPTGSRKLLTRTLLWAAKQI